MENGCSQNGYRISVRTSLIYSKPMSDHISRDVYLKLENTQPSGSFKLRGLGYLCEKKADEGCRTLVGSSGGNAGVALAYAAEKLKLPAKIFVPNYVPERMLEKLRAYEGVEVLITGSDWQDANDKALEELKDPRVGYIHPYDHPTIWEGHAKIVEEIKADLKGVKPSCLVVSVGGGGLLMGMLQGLQKAGWADVPVLAMETYGSDCFNQSIKEGKIVSFRPTSVAKTLGARSVIPQLMDKLTTFHVVSEVLEDKEAVYGCLKLADDHGFMVEPSCGVTMASVYSKVLPQALDKRGFDTKSGPIVLIVCGGSDVNPQIMEELKNMFHL